MKTRVPFFLTLIALVAILLSACGAAATKTPPYVESAPVAQAPAAEQPAVAGGAPLALPTAGAALDKGIQPGGANAANAFDARMIVKNADIKLEVADTDIAIDRTTQLVGDLGGYIISSRVWVQAYYEFNLKYATLTIGLPVDQFERALTRLRALSVKVLDETASGEDVTNQFVDLQSQLTNLEATRERIKSFLDNAKTVDEALRINQQLSDIEKQIEQIKGQMNYLQNRSAFSTITINFEPQLPEIVSTPTPTPTPSVWNPGKTFTSATKTVTSAYQGIIEFLIWFFVVIVPILAPPFLIVWGLWKLLRRKPK